MVLFRNLSGESCYAEEEGAREQILVLNALDHLATRLASTNLLLAQASRFADVFHSVIVDFSVVV